MNQDPLLAMFQWTFSGRILLAIPNVFICEQPVPFN